jgi:hypothetical protein
VRGGALIRAIFLSLLVACAALDAQADRLATLQAYASCEGFANGIRIKRQSRRPAESEPWREVTAKGETRKISVVDGMRTIYTWPEKDPFADLKVEASDPAKYAEDKRVLERMFEAAAKTEGPGAYRTLKGRHYTGQEVVKPALEGSMFAITQLFFDADKIVVSIYFPNVHPLGRSFGDHKQFVALRAAFMQGYLDCLEKRLK